MDFWTIVLAVILIIAAMGRCVVDWIELRNWWWEVITYEPEEEGKYDEERES